MRIIIARHGETEWNVENRVLGRTDIPLNKKGIEQAHILSEQLLKEKIELIITSPLIRAKQTGKIISEKIKIPLLVDPILIEQDFGCYEGVDRNNQEYQLSKRQYASKYPKGESYFDVVSRIYPFINQLKNKKQYETVLIITHGGVCRIINSFFENMENESFASFTMPNCGFKIYDL